MAIVLACSAGCATTGGQTRMRLTGPQTDATHGTKTQRPAVVEMLTITIEPAGGPWVPNPSATRVDYPGKATTPAPRRKAAAQPEPKPAPHASLDETLRAAIQAAADSGSRLTIQHSRTVEASEDTTDSTLRDRGATVDSRGHEQDLDIDQEPRRLTLPWFGNAEGGGMGLTAQLTGSGAAVLYLLGGLCMIGALIPVFLPPRRLGLAAAMAGTGVLLIASATVAEQYPWLMALAFVAFVGVGSWLAYDAWNSRRKSRAIEPIAKAIEHAPNAADIKADIEAYAGTALDQVRAVVRPVKKRLRKRGEIDANPKTPPVRERAAPAVPPP